MSNALVDHSNSFADAVERAGDCIVTVNEGGRAGVSGTIWRDSLVVTAEHTIRGQQEVTIESPNGGSSSAAVVGRDPTTDVALLRLKDPLPAKAEFADPARLRVGNFVLAVGRRGKQGLAASLGIISAISGAWHSWRGGRIDHWFRLDLLPFTGFSGGPLVDVQGKVIGINTSGPRRSVLTVPTPTVNRVVDQLLAKGHIPRGFLGVGLQPVRIPSLPSTSAAGTTRGLVVIMLEPGGPAEKGGLMVGDIVLGLGDKPLTETTDLRETLDPEQVGKTIRLRILRGGQTQDVSLIVAESPQ
jgi:S1-C subfamily serine protease